MQQIIFYYEIRKKIMTRKSVMKIFAGIIKIMRLCHFIFALSEG